jgi:predicted TIM-barrel fold metal-dependent hydrolase
MKGMDAVRELDHLVTDRGFRGLSLRPFMLGLAAEDRRYYPLYAKCVELGIPLSIHTSANWTTVAVSDLGHPRHIDVVAADFPELEIIMSHAGYPWVLEAVLLAWKHPNVYLELAAHRPRYIAAPGTGWEPLLRFGPRTIREKVMFGTGWFLLGRPPGQVLEEFRELPVPDDVMELWLHGNAERLLGTPLAAAA